MTTPEDFLIEAENLLMGARASEIRGRSAISRAYYACHHAANQVAREAGYRFDPNARQGMHKHLNGFLATNVANDDESREAIRELVRLYQDRVRADYKLDKTISFADAQDAVTRSREVMAILMDR